MNFSAVILVKVMLCVANFNSRLVSSYSCFGGVRLFRKWVVQFLSFNIQWIQWYMISYIIWYVLTHKLWLWLFFVYKEEMEFLMKKMSLKRDWNSVWHLPGVKWTLSVALYFPSSPLPSLWCIVFSTSTLKCEPPWDAGKWPGQLQPLECHHVIEPLSNHWFA